MLYTDASLGAQRTGERPDADVTGLLRDPTLDLRRDLPGARNRIILSSHGWYPGNSFQRSIHVRDRTNEFGIGTSPRIAEK